MKTRFSVALTGMKIYGVFHILYGACIEVQKLFSTFRIKTIDVSNRP